MPTSRKTTKAAMAAAAAMPSIPKELIDQFVTGPMSAEAVNAASMAFKKALIERAMGAELSHHLGYRDGEPRPDGQANHRHGHTGKTVLTEDGPVRIAVPRDRDGDFEPILIPKHARRFTGCPSSPSARRAFSWLRRFSSSRSWSNSACASG